MPSWTLVDAQAIADENPYTFYKPSKEVMDLLEVGHNVKAIFAFGNDDPEAPNAERMWVLLTKIEEGKYTGTLDNYPHFIKDLHYNDEIILDEKHIIDVEPDDPVPSMVDKYSQRCMVTKKVLHDNAGVGFLYREPPDKDEDSGWRILAGDETTDYLDDADNIFVVSLGAVLSVDDRFIDLLDKPEGSEFVYDPELNTYVDAD